MRADAIWLKRRMLEEDRPFIGTWSVIPDPTHTDVVCSSGIDFIVIDGEHGPANHRSAQEQAITCDSRGVSPIMRCSPATPEEVLRCLETGVQGLHFASISSADEAEAVVRMSKYRPAGVRGFSPFTRAGGYSPRGSDAVRRHANEDQLIVAHLEGLGALKRLSDILEVPGIDVLFVGLYDLSDSLGIPGRIDDELVVATLKDVVAEIRGSGRWAGSISTTERQLEMLIDLDIKYITHSADCFVLKSAYEDIVEFANSRRRRSH